MIPLTNWIASRCKMPYTKLNDDAELVPIRTLLNVRSNPSCCVKKFISFFIDPSCDATHIQYILCQFYSGFVVRSNWISIHSTGIQSYNLHHVFRGFWGHHLDISTSWRHGKWLYTLDFSDIAIGIFISDFNYHFSFMIVKLNSFETLYGNCVRVL